MKQKKVLFFLSPIPFEFHNRQIALFAEKLSDDFKVIYFDCSSIFDTTVSLFEMLFKEHRQRVKGFWHDLSNSSKTLVQKPVILTFLKYKKDQELFGLDKLLFKYQLEKIVDAVSYDKKCFIWTSTLSFDRVWKDFDKVSWVFDYFDRFPQETKEIAITEKWLLKRSKLIIVNSNVYYNIAVRISGDKNKVIETPIGYYLKPYLKVKAIKKKGKIIVGYGGGLSDRLDFDLVISAVKNNPDLEFVFAGPVYERSLHTLKKPYTTAEFIKRLKEFSNVKLIPTQNGIEGIKKIMSMFTVGWIPYNKKVPFNKYSTPTKFYEYCAFGLPTVSVRLEVLKDYKGMIEYISKGKDIGKIIKKILRTETGKKVLSRKLFAAHNDISNKYKIVIKALRKID